jgi:hypothetical protein
MQKLILALIALMLFNGNQATAGGKVTPKEFILKDEFLWLKIAQDDSLQLEAPSIVWRFWQDDSLIGKPSGNNYLKSYEEKYDLLERYFSDYRFDDLSDPFNIDVVNVLPFQDSLVNMNLEWQTEENFVQTDSGQTVQVIKSIFYLVDDSSGRDDRQEVQQYYLYRLLSPDSTLAPLPPTRYSEEEYSRVLIDFDYQSGKLTFDVSDLPEEKIKISLLDISGQLILEIFNGRNISRKISFVFNERFRPGRYFIVLENSYGITTKPFVYFR